MLFRIIPTTGFIKSKLGSMKNEWRKSATIKCTADDVRRDMKAGEPIALMEHTRDKDWRWVAIRNLEQI